MVEALDYRFGYDVKAEYFRWLCDLVDIEQEDRSYSILARDLFRKEFVALVKHDENRASDGLELREEYLREINYPKYVEIEGECSVLEMLIALARRIDFETSDPYDLNNTVDRTSYWFWEMIDNLGLIEFSDDCYVEYDGSFMVDAIVDRWLDREYSWDGNGGIFPLKYTNEDQRDVEIWYQMNMYLNEKCAV